MGYFSKQCYSSTSRTGLRVPPRMATQIGTRVPMVAERKMHAACGVGTSVTSLIRVDV